MSAAPPAVFLVRCQNCSHQVFPHDIVRWPGGVMLCRNCYDRHEKAMAMLANTITPACQECGVTYRALQETIPGGNTVLKLHHKDGIYQVLCPKCSEAYTRKRRDLYGQTEFGHRLNLN